MAEDKGYEIHFEGVSLAQASEYARTLEASIRDIGSGVDVKRAPDGEGHQDFGATLILIFGTPVAVALAERIGDWLKAHRNASVTIKRKDGSEAVLTGVTSKDATRITDEFLRG